MSVSRERHTVRREVRDMKTSGGTDSQQLKIHIQRNRKVWSVKGKKLRNCPSGRHDRLTRHCLKDAQGAKGRRGQSQKKQ